MYFFERTKLFNDSNVTLSLLCLYLQQLNLTAHLLAFAIDVVQPLYNILPLSTILISSFKYAFLFLCKITLRKNTTCGKNF